MITTYIYIDDDKLSDAQEKVQGFEQSNLRIITSQHKGTWESQMSFIMENEKTLDGLLLDLRLDDFPNENGDRANFRGTSLAQEIRTRQKEGGLKSFPIILFSGNDKLEKSLENSGEDLFDICIDKGKVYSQTFDELTPKLVSLSDGYKKLSLKKSISEILGINQSEVDERFIAELSDLINKPSHVITRFIINELINKHGLLIDEQILAARLGVDIKSSSDWEMVLKSLESTKYNGIFSNGWHRWWMPLVENWWKTINTQNYLQSTPASQRVKLIKEHLNLKNINAAKRIEKADSEEYWTICKGYNSPLDPIDGLMIEGQENLYPWQDAQYVSIEAALKRKNNQAWKKVAKLEEERLKELGIQFKKNR